MQPIRFASWVIFLQVILFFVWSFAVSIILRWILVTLPNAFGANITFTQSPIGAFILYAVSMVICALITYVPHVIPSDDPSLKTLRTVLINLDTEVLVLGACIYFFVDLNLSPQLSAYFASIPAALNYIGMGIRMIITGLLDALTPPSVILVTVVSIVSILLTRVRNALTLLPKKVAVPPKKQQPQPQQQPQQSQQQQPQQQPQQQSQPPSPQPAADGKQEGKK